jgi:hypothetical protein
MTTAPPLEMLPADHAAPHPHTVAATVASTTMPALVAITGEAALLWLLATGKINAVLFAAGHLVVVAALTAYVRHIARNRGDTTAAIIFTVAVAATGLIGAVGGLINGLMPARRPTGAKLLREWYQRIALSADVDQITRLCDDVSSGRHVGLTTPAPVSFVTVLERGSLSNRQAALGLMARHIKPEYLPALKAALQSTEPVIRVQAAAVATKIRPELRALVDKAVLDLAADRISPAHALRHASDLEACVASGLLDAGDRIRADVTIPRLKALANTVAMPTTHVSAAQETVLLEQGRFRELRVARRTAAAVGSMGRVRRRSVGVKRSRAVDATGNRPQLQEVARPDHQVTAS